MRTRHLFPISHFSNDYIHLNPIYHFLSYATNSRERLCLRVLAPLFAPTLAAPPLVVAEVAGSAASFPPLPLTAAADEVAVAAELATEATFPFPPLPLTAAADEAAVAAEVAADAADAVVLSATSGPAATAEAAVNCENWVYKSSGRITYREQQRLLQ